MKFGCSLEMINLRRSGPNQWDMQSKTYWVGLLKSIAAAGFKGIEMQYNPYMGDPVTFEIGRCGVPISRFAVESQYGGVAEFKAMLKDFGIDDITGIHISANDTMLELIARLKDKAMLFDEFIALSQEALDFAQEAGVSQLIVSPTPEIGFVNKYFGGVDDFEKKTVETIQKIADIAAEKSISIAICNEFWSVYRGERIIGLMESLKGGNIFYSPDLTHLTIADANIKEMIGKFAGRIAAPRFNDTSFVDTVENYKKPNAEIPSEGPQRLFYDMGDGNIDLCAAVKALDKAGFEGTVICECRKALDIYKALLKMRWYVDHVIVNRGIENE